MDDAARQIASPLVARILVRRRLRMTENESGFLGRREMAKSALLGGAALLLGPPGAAGG